MINQKSFEHQNVTYLMVAVQFVDEVVIRVSREGNFLFDCNMSNETYSGGSEIGLNLIEDAFVIIESKVMAGH